MPSFLPRRAAVAIVLVALVVRLGAGFWWQSRLPPEKRFFFGDSDSYWTLGQRLAAGETYEYESADRRVFRAPGYPLLLAGHVPRSWAPTRRSCAVGHCERIVGRCGRGADDRLGRLAVRCSRRPIGRIDCSRLSGSRWARRFRAQRGGLLPADDRAALAVGSGQPEPLEPESLAIVRRRRSGRRSGHADQAKLVAVYAVCLVDRRLVFARAATATGQRPDDDVAAHCSARALVDSQCARHRPLRAHHAASWRESV